MPIVSDTGFFHTGELLKAMQSDVVKQYVTSRTEACYEEIRWPEKCRVHDMGPLLDCVWL